MSRIAAFLMGLFVCAGGAWADVIPSRSPARQQASYRSTVKQKLARLGLPATDIDRQVADLSGKDLSYFAEHPRRIVLAGAQDDGEEDEDPYREKMTIGKFILGTLAIAGGVAAIVVPIVLDHRK